MQIRCPHCHNPSEIVDDTSLSDITCNSCGSRFSLIGGETTAAHTAEDTRRIGSFELIDQLGVGHFGSVWMARDTRLDRTVALKIPRKGRLNAAETEFFFREARAAAQLKHPGIVAVHEVGRDDETVYIVSDYIRGASLKEWLTTQRLTPREAAGVCVPIAAALHHAHEKGVIHRDLKPGNIMMDVDGEPHIADFGLAKRETGEITMTVEGKVLGTPAYMSPEQAKGEGHRADRRSDIYSLGVILFELMTGELPFRGEPRMLIVQILSDEPPGPRKLNALVPRDLETICLKCLQKDPQRRYQTADELAADLGRYLGRRPIEARPIGRVQRAWRWARRNPALAIACAAAFLLLSVVAVGSTLSAVMIDRERRAAEEHRGFAEIARDRERQQRLRAQEAEGQARRNADLARQSEQNTIAALQQEELARQQAETSLQQARQAVDDYFTLISENTLLDIPGMQGLRKELLQRALTYHERFIEQRTDDPELRAEAAAAYLRMAQAYQTIGMLDESTQSLERGITAIEKLVSEGNDVAMFPSLRAGVMQVPHFRYREPRRSDNPRKVLRLVERALELWSAFCDRHPDVEGFRLDLAGFHYQRGIVQNATREPAAALESFTSARDILEELVVAHPDVGRYRDQLTVVCGRVGSAVARRDPSEAARIYRDGIAKNPDNPFLYNRLSWMLATHPDPEVRNAAEAVATAQRAVELEPRDRNYWNSLGVAYYRDRQWQEAVDALEKSMQLQSGGDRYDWIFLAMALAQRGERERGLRWYHKAVDAPAGLEVNFLRFKMEADELFSPQPEAKGENVEGDSTTN